MFGPNFPFWVKLCPCPMSGNRPRESRQLESQIKTCLAVQQHPQDRCLVMEVFSPPRFSLEAEKHYFRARSYDLKNGWDFRLAQHRRKVEDYLINDTPSLLILCPPCTHEGGWFWLNSQKWDPHTVLRVKAQSRSFIRASDSGKNLASP